VVLSSDGFLATFWGGFSFLSFFSFILIPSNICVGFFIHFQSTRLIWNLFDGPPIRHKNFHYFFIAPIQ
jgi:hypothetical protein